MIRHKSPWPELDIYLDVRQRWRWDLAVRADGFLCRSCWGFKTRAEARREAHRALMALAKAMGYRIVKVKRGKGRRVKR